MLNVEKIISNYYSSKSKIYKILLIHGRQVAKKSLEILDNMPSHYTKDVDRDFVIEASMLHDVGVCTTYAESIGCSGSLPYICHGVEGRKMLDKIGLNKHGYVCERHIGAGISSENIIQMNLPIPVKDMLPVSLEEKLICYSDKFFSKGSGKGEKSINAILECLIEYGEENAERFLKLHEYFSLRE